MTDRSLVVPVAAIASAVLVLAAASVIESHLVAPPPDYADASFRAFEPSPDPVPTDGADLPDPREVPPSPTPEPTVRPTPRPTDRPEPARVPSPRNPKVTISGKASWYATGRDGRFAAACRPLRRALGPDWRGQQVLVGHGPHGIVVTLNDWCGSHDKLIDLSDEVFRFFAPLSRGVVQVYVEGFR